MGFHSFLEKDNLSQHKEFLCCTICKLLLVFYGLLGGCNNNGIMVVVPVENSARGLQSCQTYEGRSFLCLLVCRSFSGASTER